MTVFVWPLARYQRGFELTAEPEAAGSRGHTDHTGKIVNVDPGYPLAEQVHFLVHELGHSRCGHEQRRDVSRAQRERRAGPWTSGVEWGWVSGAVLQGVGEGGAGGDRGELAAGDERDRGDRAQPDEDDADLLGAGVSTVAELNRWRRGDT